MFQFQNGNEDYDDQLLMAVNHKEENMRKAERNVLLGGRHVTVVKVEIISSSNARRYMQCSSSKMVMKIMITSCSWL